MAQGFNTIRHRWLRCGLPARSALVAATIAGAATMLLLGSCSVAGSSVRVEEPLTSVAVTGEIAALDDVSAQASADTAVDPRVVADNARSALDAASGAEEANLFNAMTGIDRTLDAAEIPEIDNAVTAFHDAGYSVGFVIYDLFTNKGIGYNADEQFFSASTVKAPYVAFAVQDMIDGGLAAFDEEVVQDVMLDGTGVMAFDETDVYDLQTVLGNTIVHSDNTGYALLRERFDDEAFAAWCAAADVDASDWAGEWYPYFSTRDLAKLWLNVGAYIADDQGGAGWFGDVLTRSGHSFLSEALGDRHRILSKPGYEISTLWYDIGALNDAGLVLTDNGAYVVAIMSNADYDDEYFTDNESLIVDLVEAIDATHERLLVEEEAA